nr:MAG TPA: hypothetical protein [Microviridae sp.]
MIRICIFAMALPYLISKIYRIFFFMKSIYIILNSD